MKSEAAPFEDRDRYDYSRGYDDHNAHDPRNAYNSPGHKQASSHNPKSARMLVCDKSHFDRFGPASVLPSPPQSLSLSLSPPSMSSHLQSYTPYADTSHGFSNITPVSSINSISNIGSIGNIGNSFSTQQQQPPPLNPKEEDAPDYMLEIRQQPQHARVALGKDKADRKPIDPPPILQLKVSAKKDPNQHFLQSPYYFMSCSLIKGDDSSSKAPLASHLIGTAVSSLHRLKDTDNQDGGFFVFGDLSCKVEGKFRLLFTLYQMQRMECLHITSIVSQPFQVYPTKSFPGLAESTFLTRSFSDQGVRLRLRKDSRSISTRKRNATAADFSRKPDPRDAVGPGASVGSVGRRSIGGRTGSTDDSTYGVSLTGAGFDPSTSYGSYDADSSSFSKRRRMIDDLGTPVSSVGSVMTTNPYGVPSIYGTTTAQMQMPVSTVGAGSYSLSAMQPLSTMSYGGHTGHAHHSHHQLNRIDTQQSPSTRQSPHAFSYGGGLQTSPSSINDYRSLYGNTVSTADTSPRTHATPNPHSTTTPSGTSTSPPDATGNYTAQSGVGVGALGVGSMASFTQSMAPYAYTSQLDQHQHQQYQPQHHSQHQSTRVSHLPSLDLHHVGSTGLGLDLNYTEVDRHGQN